MGTLIGNDYERILNELYVGETPFIKKFTEVVAAARAPYVGKLKKPIKGNKDFIKIGDMLAEEFGFHSVSFSVPYDTSMNAFTYPITMAVDKTIIGVKPKFFANNGLKYDPITNRMSIIVAVTSGVWFNKEISDREVVAAILHEIGHSFVTQSERTVDIIEANRLSLALTLYYQLILHLINPVTWTMIPADIKNIMRSSNKGKEITNKISKELAENPLFFGFNGAAAVAEWLSGIAMNIFKEILTLFSGPMKLIAIPFAALEKILAPFTAQDTAITRSQEYLSDSFATMYGMGPEISSFLAKIELDPKASGSTVEYIISKIPVVGALHQSLSIPVLMLTNSLTTHPSTPARINKILDELEKELKDSDLSPKAKEAVRKNIKDLQKIKDEFTAPVDKKKYDAEMVKRMWFNFITNKGEIANDLESYYTDLKTRDKYVREFFENPLDDVDII